MKDNNRSRYDYGESEYEEETEEENGQNEAEQNSEPEKQPSGIKLLTSIQIISSVIVLVAAVLLRFFGGELYSSVRTWYVNALNDSIVAEEQMDQAKHTVIGLWNSISSAGPQLSAQSSRAQSSQSLSGSKPSAASAVSSAGQNSQPAAAAGNQDLTGTDDTAQVSP